LDGFKDGMTSVPALAYVRRAEAAIPIPRNDNGGGNLVQIDGNRGPPEQSVGWRPPMTRAGTGHSRKSDLKKP
jgi:hypothetical protein